MLYVMNCIIRNSIAAFLLFAGCSLGKAHDFTATVGGQKLFFNIKSKTNKTVEVTYSGSISDKNISEVTGNIDIPAKVKHNNVVYSVVSIGAKSFSGASKLEGITIPATVKSIGGFAFEGCTSLIKVVFPGGDVAFGEGVFFKCASIRDITLGSDWKNVDLSRFRWSDSLTTITIPAKIEKIQGLKTLKNLRSVTVDVNNSRFSSVDGVLYNKDGKTLYGCPRSYNGTLRIKDGTEVISKNALIDCPLITQIDFPATIKSFSFRETSRMADLETIIFRGKVPVTTAYAYNEGKFVLQVKNADVKVIVPNDSKKEYKSALVQEGGEFATSKDANSTPYVVKVNQMPKAGNIVGVKNFLKYN